MDLGMMEMLYSPGDYGDRGTADYTGDRSLAD
jgi:hypothetical protein